MTLAAASVQRKSWPRSNATREAVDSPNIAVSFVSTATARIYRDHCERQQASRDHFLDDFPSPFRTSPEEEQRLAEQAKNFPVKKLPYRGERYSLKYDRRTHASRRRGFSRALGDAELSFADFQNGFHIKSRATAHEMRLLYTPEFSKDLELLKLVVAQQGYCYALNNLPGVRAFYGGGERVPQGFVRNREALETLVNKAVNTRRKLAAGNHNYYRLSEWADRHKGYVALRATIAYRAWREAKDSATIAAELGMTWVAVRQILHRLCICARRLGLETFPRHHSCFKTTEMPFKESANTPQPYRLYKRQEEPAEESLDLTDGVVARLLADEIARASYATA
jgi:hypothetical protein